MSRCSIALSVALLFAPTAQSGCSEIKRDSPAEKSPNVTVPPDPLVFGGTMVEPPDGHSKVSPSPSGSSAAAGTSVVKPRPLSLSGRPTPDPDSLALGLVLGLEAHFEWPDKESTLRPQPADTSVEDPAKSRFALSIALHGAGKMKIALTSEAFSLRSGTQLLARYDALGMFLLWPDGTQYRVLGQGTLRNLLAEGRLDVTPNSPGKIEVQADGARLGIPTQRYKLTTPYGELLLEQSAVEGSELGGPLLCRFLLEWVSLQDNGTICQPGQVPLWAEVKGPSEGQLRFVVNALTRTSDAQFETPVPPTLAKFVVQELPAQSSAIHSPEILSALSAGAPARLEVHNRSEKGAYLVLQGARLVFVPPRKSRTVTGIASGEYSYLFRGFFGEEHRSEAMVSVPSTVVLEEPGLDAGAPPP